MGPVNDPAHCPAPIVQRAVALGQAYWDSMYHFLIEVFPRIVPLLDGVVLNDPAMCVASVAASVAASVVASVAASAAASAAASLPRRLPPRLPRRLLLTPLRLLPSFRLSSALRFALITRLRLRFVHIGDAWPAPDSAEWDALKGSKKYVGRTPRCALSFFFSSIILLFLLILFFAPLFVGTSVARSPSCLECPKRGSSEGGSSPTKS